MNTDKIYSQAQKMAAAAKPGILKHDGKVYTLVFNQTEWVYDVFEDGFFLMKYNTKKIAQAKKWLKQHLEN